MKSVSSFSSIDDDVCVKKKMELRPFVFVLELFPWRIRLWRPFYKIVADVWCTLFNCGGSDFNLAGLPREEALGES